MSEKKQDKELRLTSALKKTFLELFNENTQKVILTNKYKNQSNLLQKGVTYSLEITEQTINLRKDKQDFKDSLTYHFDSHTLINKNQVLENETKLQFFNTMIQIAKELRGHHVFIFRNDTTK